MRPACTDLARYLPAIDRHHAADHAIALDAAVQIILVLYLIDISEQPDDQVQYVNSRINITPPTVMPRSKYAPDDIGHSRALPNSAYTARTSPRKSSDSNLRSIHMFFWQRHQCPTATIRSAFGPHLQLPQRRQNWLQPAFRTARPAPYPVARVSAVDGNAAKRRRLLHRHLRPDPKSVRSPPRADHRWPFGGRRSR